MFGLSDSKKKKGKAPFDLEMEIKKNPQKYHDLRNHAIDRMHVIKNMLLAGEKKENFNELGSILHGYVSLLKILGKVYERKSSIK